MEMIVRMSVHSCLMVCCPRLLPVSFPIPFTSLTHLIPLPFTLSSFFLQSSRHERGTSE